MLHIFADWERIVGHINKCNIFHEDIRISFRLTVLILRAFDQALDRSCKCDSVVGYGKIIPDGNSTLIGEGCRQPYALPVGRIKLRPRYVIRMVYNILPLQIEIHLRPVTVRCRTGHRHAQ